MRLQAQTCLVGFFLLGSRDTQNKQKKCQTRYVKNSFSYVFFKGRFFFCVCWIISSDFFLSKNNEGRVLRKCFFFWRFLKKPLESVDIPQFNNNYNYKRRPLVQLKSNILTLSVFFFCYPKIYLECRFRYVLCKVYIK